MQSRALGTPARTRATTTTLHLPNKKKLIELAKLSLSEASTQGTRRSTSVSPVSVYRANRILLVLCMRDATERDTSDIDLTA